tara:strand:- start:399 stop:683 length:285 start_codon:yes stop_codon:yes gene_type:complete
MNVKTLHALAKADKDRYNRFDRRRFFGEELGLASKFIPEDISNEDVTAWKKAQVFPESIVKTINIWGKGQKNPDEFLNNVLKNNSYKEDEWKFE